MADISQADGMTEASSQANIPNERPVYEVGFHVVPTVPEDGVGAVVDRIRAALGDAEIVSEQLPQKMTLAYTIERAAAGRREKYQESYFGSIKFALEREQIPALEAALRSMKEVLRFLLIETVREDISAPTRRAVFASDRLKGETIKRPEAAEPERKEEKSEVSEEELDKSIDALVS